MATLEALRGAAAALGEPCAPFETAVIGTAPPALP
jgi:hypothetical protein